MFFKSELEEKQQEKEKQTYLEFLKRDVVSVSEAEIREMTSSYLRLLETLKTLAESAGEEPVILISIGCFSGNSEQQIPSYLKNIAQNKKVNILLIDGLYRREVAQNNLIAQHNLESKNSTAPVFLLKGNPNINVEIFGCYIDVKPASSLCQKMAETIINLLKKKGRVFIGNHVQAYSFVDIPGIAELANRIKVDYPNTFQLYTQAGSGRVRYYLDKQINYETDQYGMPDNGTFKTCSKLSDLQEIDEFKPEFPVIPAKLLGPGSGY